MTAVYFLCGSSSDALHDAFSLVKDKRVYDCTFVLRDTVFYAKVSAGDVIPQEANYPA